MEIVHYSVLKNEVVSFLKPDRPGELFVDCTTGEGGHSEALLSVYPDIELTCLDTDAGILGIAQQRLEPFLGRVSFCNTWFNNYFENYPADMRRPDKILFDLGISTYHYEKSGRGFSFRKDEPLSMQLGSGMEVSAGDMVNNYPADKLADDGSVRLALCRERVSVRGSAFDGQVTGEGLHRQGGRGGHLHRFAGCAVLRQDEREARGVSDRA